MLSLMAVLNTQSSQCAELPNLNLLEPDLALPVPVLESPVAGRRVLATTRDWEGTAVRHTLYLPHDWKPNATFPVIVEYAGNGGFRNALGDACDGTVESCALGYGLSGGSGYIWICLPFVEVTAQGDKRNSAKWWGDVSETKRYCLATIRDVCRRYGGDDSNIVLCGFSRGAIAGNYIGLHDDEIAKLWRAFFCHSHYDGVRPWPYVDSDADSARLRLKRLRGREQWISHEGSVSETRSYLEGSGIRGKFTFAALPYANHSSAWVLRDLPERRQARAWLARVTNSSQPHTPAK